MGGGGGGVGGGYIEVPKYLEEGQGVLVEPYYIMVGWQSTWMQSTL